MQKSKKILMTVVAILLILAMFSTCLLSSVYAKFVSTDEIKMNFNIEKFGITVSLDVDNDLKSACGTYQETVTGDSITATFTNLQMLPGTDFTDMITFTIDGKAEVKSKIVIDIEITLDGTKFKLDKAVGGVPKDEYAVPIDFPCSMTDINGRAAYYFWDYFYPLSSYCDIGSSSLLDRDYLILYNIYASSYYNQDGSMDLNENSDSSGTYMLVSKMFDVDDDIYVAAYYADDYTLCKVQKFNFGFSWPFEQTDKTYDYDVLDEYIASKNPSISVSYTFRIEQVQ